MPDVDEFSLKNHGMADTPREERRDQHLPHNASQGHPAGGYPADMGFHEDNFSEMRESAIFIFSSSSAVATSSSDR